jgi:hypothetical protein
MKSESAKTGLVPCQTKLGLPLVFREQELISWLFDPTTKFDLKNVGLSLAGGAAECHLTIRFCDKTIKINYGRRILNPRHFCPKRFFVDDEPMYISPYLDKEFARALPFVRRVVQRVKLGVLISDDAS